MKSINSFPYLRPSRTHITVTNWLLLEKENETTLPQVLDHWDPGMPLAMRVAVQIDTARIWEDCQLAADNQLRLVIIWSSSGTGLRGKGEETVNFDFPQEPQKVFLEAHVDGSNLARTVDFEVQLILSRAGKDYVKIAPHLPGSILWNEGRRLIIEGKGTRFPMESLKFADTQWLPASAGWYLDWKAKALEEEFLASVCLYLNETNKLVQKAIEASTREGKLIREMILFDVGKTMVISALANDDFVLHHAQYKEGSVGASIKGLLHAYFPNEHIEGIAQRYQNSPTRVECELQEHFGIFNEV